PGAYKMLQDEEDKNQGTTFLRYLKPEHRAGMIEKADAQIRAKQDQIWQDEQRERTRLNQALDKSDSDFKSDFFARLNDPQKNGIRTRDALEAANTARTIKPETYELFSKLLKVEQVQGGVTDPAVMKRLSIEVYNTNVPAQQRLDDLTAAWRQ